MMLGEHRELSQLICKLYFVRFCDFFHTENTQESKSEATHAIPTHLTASIALISRILTLAWGKYSNLRSCFILQSLMTIPTMQELVLLYCYICSKMYSTNPMITKSLH